MMLRKVVIFFLCFLIFVGATGCTPELKKKFIRKPKKKKKPEPVVCMEGYSEEYSITLSYKNHYLFWKAWHDELINALDGNRKKQIQCSREILNNLKEMEELLIGEKKESLKSRIEILHNINNQIVKRPLDKIDIRQMKDSLRRQKRAIEREFAYEKAKEWLRE